MLSYLISKANPAHCTIIGAPRLQTVRNLHWWEQTTTQDEKIINGQNNPGTEV